MSKENWDRVFQVATLLVMIIASYFGIEIKNGIQQTNQSVREVKASIVGLPAASKPAWPNSGVYHQPPTTKK